MQLGKKHRPGQPFVVVQTNEPSARDRVNPADGDQMIFAAAQKPKTLTILHGYEHNRDLSRINGGVVVGDAEPASAGDALLENKRCRVSRLTTS